MSLQILIALAAMLFPASPGTTPAVITGTESWLARSEAGDRGIVGCTYRPLLDYPNRGSGSVYPSGRQLRAMIEALRGDVETMRRASGGALIIVDGVDDETEFATRRVQSVFGGSDDTMEHFLTLHHARAENRAWTMSKALLRALPGLEIRLGAPHTQQASGLRGVIVMVCPSPPPQRSEAAEATVRDSDPDVESGASSPAKPAPLAPPRPRRWSIDATIGASVHAVNTPFWGAGALVSLGGAREFLRNGRPFASVAVGYAFGDYATRLAISPSESVPEHVQHHGLHTSLELLLAERFHFGARAIIGAVHERLAGASTEQPPSRWLLSAAVGPSLVSRLYASEIVEVALRYDWLLVATPRRHGDGLGQVHVLSLRLQFRPR